MFKITRGTGFHIAFKNGYSISVQFGKMSYCEHYSDYTVTHVSAPALWVSRDAEVMVWFNGPEGPDTDYRQNVPWGHGDDVCGYLSADEVGVLIDLARTAAPGELKLLTREMLS